MQPSKFKFVEIADNIAQVIDGGMSCVDIKTAIDRWKKNHPYATDNRHWKLTARLGETIEATPVPISTAEFQMEQFSTAGGQVSAMAIGNETAIGTSVFEDAQGRLVRTSSSFSAS